MKERLGITEMRKTANRMNFGDVSDMCASNNNLFAVLMEAQACSSVSLEGKMSNSCIM